MSVNWIRAKIRMQMLLPPFLGFIENWVISTLISEQANLLLRNTSATRGDSVYQALQILIKVFVGLSFIALACFILLAMKLAVDRYRAKKNME